MESRPTDASHEPLELTRDSGEHISLEKTRRLVRIRTEIDPENEYISAITLEVSPIKGNRRTDSEATNEIMANSGEPTSAGQPAVVNETEKTTGGGGGIAGEQELSRGETTPRQPNPGQHPGKKTRKRTNISQKQVETAVRVFVAEHQEAYEILKKARAENRPKSKGLAQSKFGRNALARAVTKSLGRTISPSRLTATKAWREIKKDLFLGDTPSENHRRNKIGLEIAGEQAAEKAGNTTMRAVLDRELIVRINAELPEAAASKLICQYQLGDIDENGIELNLEAYADQVANPPDVRDDDRRESRPRRRKSRS